jgi:hypothetical protein
MCSSHVVSRLSPNIFDFFRLLHLLDFLQALSRFYASATIFAPNGRWSDKSNGAWLDCLEVGEME